MTRAACEMDHSRSSTPCRLSELHNRHATHQVEKVAECADIWSELGLEQYQIQTVDHRVDLRRAACVMILLLVVAAETVALSGLAIPAVELSHTALLAGFPARTAWSFVGR
jgi:hypothetical protein